MIRKHVALILCILLLCNGIACADGVSVGQNLSAIYENMVQAFELGEFATALGLFDTTPALTSYKDALSYQRYMKAREMVTEDDYENAILLFKTIEAFHDSDCYLAYAQGRKAEEKGEYSDAVSYYILAANLEQSGVDVMDRLKFCNQNVFEEEKRQKYEDAVKSYERAMESGLRSDIMSCLTVFCGLGDYLESTTYAARCEAWIQAADRKVAFTKITASTNTIQLIWEDNETGKCYRLRYRAQGMNNWNILETTKTSAYISDLIPGTVYEVNLEDVELPEKKLSVDVQTDRMRVFDDIMLSATRGCVIGIKRLALKQKTAIELINEYETQLLKPEKNQFTVSDMDDYALYLSVSIENSDIEDDAFDSWFVLRTASHGVYGTEKTTVSLPGSQLNILINWDISPLLKQIKDEHGTLPPDTYTVEMMLGDGVLSQVSFEIQ